MEWSLTSNVRNERVAFMPSPCLDLESNFSDLLGSFNYDSYTGTSSTHAVTQTEPGFPVPELEKITEVDESPSNNVVKKKKALTSEQLASLEQSFQEDIRLEPDRKLKLSEELGLQPRQVAVWFQNRRARWKVKHLEESYDMLRLKHDVVCREKQMLQHEVKKLRDIILRNQGFMKTQANPDGHQMNGIGEYNNPMMVASSSWPPKI